MIRTVCVILFAGNYQLIYISLTGTHVFINKKALRNRRKKLIWWARLDSNQRCRTDGFYRPGWYQLHSTDPNIMVSLCFKGRPQLPGGPHFTRQGYLYIPCGRWLPVPSLVVLFISITRGPSPYVHNLRIYSISEETQSELRGATPNFWPQSHQCTRVGFPTVPIDISKSHAGMITYNFHPPFRIWF